jgi:hypothetical protein
MKDSFRGLCRRFQSERNEVRCCGSPVPHGALGHKYSAPRSLVRAEGRTRIFPTGLGARTGTAQRWARRKSNASSMWPATHLPRYPVRRCDGSAPRGWVGGGWGGCERVVCRRATGWESDACLPAPSRAGVLSPLALQQSAAPEPDRSSAGGEAKMRSCLSSACAVQHSCRPLVLLPLVGGGW